MLKPLTSTIAAAVVLAGVAVAGDTTMTSGKSYKAPAPAETGCFAARELQIDVFGQTSFGSDSSIGLFRGTGWGGGVGLNYFFHRNIGLGVDAAWFSARESRLGGNPDNDRTQFHNFSGSIIFRAPIDSACLAPYAYVGGGYHVDGSSWASAHAGVGIEYRLVPQKIGLFVDGRWTYLGNRQEEDNLNFFNVRAGVRFVF